MVVFFNCWMGGSGFHVLVVITVMVGSGGGTTGDYDKVLMIMVALEATVHGW